MFNISEIAVGEELLGFLRHVPRTMGNMHDLTVYLMSNVRPGFQVLHALNWTGNK